MSHRKRFGDPSQAPPIHCIKYLSICHEFGPSLAPKSANDLFQSCPSQLLSMKGVLIDASKFCSGHVSPSILFQSSLAFLRDCGYACVLMVLRAAGIMTPSLHDLHKLCTTKSVWTVDLAHLLRKFGLEVQYKTLTYGTNPGFTEEAFYGQMHEDALRVDQLFQTAEDVGIDIEQRSVPHQELKELLLCGGHVVIALVDKDMHNVGLPLWSGPRTRSKEVGFKGHYIVLCGYCSAFESYILRDPDPRCAYLGLCTVKAHILERARKAFGTDEDLLIIPLPRAS